MVAENSGSCIYWGSFLYSMIKWNVNVTRYLLGKNAFIATNFAWNLRIVDLRVLDLGVSEFQGPRFCFQVPAFRVLRLCILDYAFKICPRCFSKSLNKNFGNTGTCPGSYYQKGGEIFKLYKVNFSSRFYHTPILCLLNAGFNIV